MDDYTLTMVGGFSLIFLVVGLFAFGIIRASRDRARMRESTKNKDPKDWTREERTFRLMELNKAYNSRQITYTQYEILKAKYLGQKSIFEELGPDASRALLQSKSGTNSTTPPKEASVVKNAVVGGIVAGPAGAVVGALHAVDKNNKNQK